MEPLSTAAAAAAGAYVAAQLAKKVADAAIGAAYRRMEAYVLKKLGWPAAKGPPDADALQKAGLDRDPEVVGFAREVLAHSPALRRAQLVLPVARGARVLWVDDVPVNNTNECRLFAALGMRVEQVGTSREAVAALGRGDYDVILSDMERDDVPDAGLKLLGQLPPGAPPLVFYIGQVDDARGIPRGAFGIADRPGSLLHLVLDVLERRRV